MKQTRIHAVILVLILVLALCTVLYHLEDSPRTWFDEGIFLHVARNIADSGVYNFTVAPGVYGEMPLITVGYPLLLPVALAMKIFGPTLFVARFVSALSIIGLLLVVFFYIRRIATPVVALWSVGLLATFSALYGHGKNLLGEVPGMFMFFTGILFFQIADESRNKNFLFASAIFFGLATATKPIFLVLLPPVLWAIYRMKNRNSISTRDSVTAVALLIIPLMAWVYFHFSSTTSFSEIFSHYANPYNENSVLHNILPNLMRFVTELTPIHFFLASLIVAFGVFRKRNDVRASEWVLFIFAVLVWASFLRTPGWYRYFFPAHIVAIVFLPVMAHRLVQSQFLRRIVFFCGACLFLVQAWYLVTHIDRFYNPAWREIEAYIKGHREDRFLFYNVPEGAFFLPHNRYYQVLTIREGLDFGLDGFTEEGPFDTVVIRDGAPDLVNIRKHLPSFIELDHIGNYYIFVRKTDVIPN